MDNSKLYLLKKIVGHNENGLSSLGELHARHIDDISKVMLDFTKESLTECVERLNKGEEIDLGGMVLSLRKIKKAAQ